MPLLPGTTIGMLGGGQLGRMFGYAAKRLGYNVITLDPTPTCPMAQVVDEQIVAAYDDVNAAKELAKRCQVISYEFENVAVKLVDTITATTPVYPGAKALAVSQHRWREKDLFKKCSIPVTPFYQVATETDLEQAEKTIGYPAVLKTCQFGYDGKGQYVINNTNEAKTAFTKLNKQELIWEKKVDFVKEISVICVRGQNGETVTYPVSENIHVNNILDITIVPARISKSSTQQAHDIAKMIAKELDIIGTFCVELFVLADGTVMANEIAPRPHNSGHYSIEACYCSQFENQLRAICGLPLGSPDLRYGTAVMINILGTGTGNTLSGVDQLMNNKNAYLHLYGKAEAKAARKMGHFTVIGDDIETLLQQAQEIRKNLKWV
ncbi:MAG: 5-(carboxyamino)imidazole ribonucleotide synthase [Patescibacteria group bacterium]|jgi:5-(carboxyamino)imidazole ribonucleotide synthase